MRILIVEDDQLVADYVRLSMKEDGHAVDVAHTGPEGETLAMVHDYDVIILDHTLPGRTGLEVLRYMRERGKGTPVLMLTAKDSEEDIVRALDIGADDHLAKPFKVGELRARIRALGRRRGEAMAPEVTLGNLTLDRLGRRVLCGGKPLAMTPKEFTLIEYLMLHPRQVVTRTDLLEKVWDMHFDPRSNVVDVHITRLRQKLRKVNPGAQLRTVRGSGFILEDA